MQKHQSLHKTSRTSRLVRQKQQNQSLTHSENSSSKSIGGWVIWSSMGVETVLWLLLAQYYDSGGCAEGMSRFPNRNKGENIVGTQWKCFLCLFCSHSLLENLFVKKCYNSYFENKIIEFHRNSTTVRKMHHPSHPPLIYCYCYLQGSLLL